MNTSSILNEDLNQPQTKNAVVIVGRFQPPTIGHYKVIDKAKKYIRENKHLNLFTKPILVIVNGEKSSKDKMTNPLSVEDRVYFMENSGRANGVVFLNAHNAFAAFNEVRKAGYEPIVVAAGSDRVEGYIKLLDDKFLDKNGKKQKHFKIGELTRHELPANEKSLKKIHDENSVDAGEVSGSLARRAVELDYFEEFVKITGLEKNIPAAKKMFKQIKAQIGEA